MRFLAVLLLVAVTLVSPASAQKSKSAYQAPMTCEAAATAMPAFSLLETSTVEAIENGCRVTNLVFDLGNGYSRFEMAEVTLVAPDLFARWAEQRLPDAVELTVKGTQFSPQTGNATTDYIIGVQQVPYNLHLKYRWNEVAGELVLVDASMRSGILGRVSVSGTMTGVSTMPSVVDGMEDIAGYGLSQVSITLTNRSLLENFAIPTLVAMLSSDTDPRAQIAALQATLRATASALPDTIADAASRQALVDFIDAFPHPRQTYDLSLTAEPPVPVTDISAIDGIPAATALLSRLKIIAAHIWPAPPAP